jgi:RNA polymerase subunit RPABC4/transcription elongation factor Spt4
MAKELAHKKTKELMTEKEIFEKKLDRTEFTDSWKGRIIVLNPEKSEIAKNIKITKAGEFAVKTR